MVVAWLVLVASGASTTGLVRAPIGHPGLAPAMLASHIAAGAALGLIVVAHLLRTRGTSRWRPIAFVAAATGLGWLAGRSFAPLTVAAHAAVAAYTLFALLPPAIAAGGDARSTHTWPGRVAGAGLILLLVQIALGALVRHHLMPVFWHVLIGGLAAIGILVPAVATTQEPSTTGDVRRAARWAIASLLVQVSLGLAVLFMILAGPPSTLAWLAGSVSHVVAGSLTLLAAAHLARVLRTPGDHGTTGGS